MARAVRLETVADARETGQPRTISISCRHEAVLDDGSRVLLLDDRGWTAGLRGAGAADIDDAWAVTTEAEIAATARVVVGPDAAHGERTQADMDDGHWRTLAETLHGHGVAADAGALRRLPHDVVLSERLRARLAPS